MVYRYSPIKQGCIYRSCCQYDLAKPVMRGQNQYIRTNIPRRARGRMDGWLIPWINFLSPVQSSRPCTSTLFSSMPFYSVFPGTSSSREAIEFTLGSSAGGYSQRCCRVSFPTFALYCLSGEGLRDQESRCDISPGDTYALGRGSRGKENGCEPLQKTIFLQVYPDVSHPLRTGSLDALVSP